MKYVPIILALLAAFIGFGVAFFRLKASGAGAADYTGLGTEPGTFEGSQRYHALAKMRGEARTGKLNRQTTYGAAVAALLSLAAGLASLFLLVSN
jgi:hypothetical protein